MKFPSNRKARLVSMNQGAGGCYCPLLLI